MPFIAAVVLREGSMTWDHYARHLGDEDTLSLCKRVSTVIDPQAETEFPAQMSGVARVRTALGLFERFVAVPKGEPENFLTAAELRAKFDGLVAPYLSEGRRDALITALLSLEQADNISALLRLTRPDRTPFLQTAPGAERVGTGGCG